MRDSRGNDHDRSDKYLETSRERERIQAGQEIGTQAGEVTEMTEEVGTY
jgi:hypothetical protein